ncbi:MAG: hypothetical protein ACFFBD_03680 [Candidatus Hodarchaeota archaeon]
MDEVAGFFDDFNHWATRSTSFSSNRPQLLAIHAGKFRTGQGQEYKPPNAQN